MKKIKQCLFIKYVWVCLWVASSASLAYGQTSSFKAQFQSKSSNAYLVGLKTVLSPINDSTQKQTSIANELGIVSYTNLKAGIYTLKASYIGYKNFETTITIGQTNPETIVFKLAENTQLKEVNIQELALRAQIKGDTLEINANAYKTNADANVQDLVGKMPGITVENGTVKAQGENVQKVTIDGKEFFGDDVNLALRNLPAEIVEKIQVYDRQSDQAAFTGFNDGNTQKAINIITKPGKNNGAFGKVYAGYGSNERYTTGGNINSFRGKQRTTIIGLSNNINQQNFASQDLVGVSGNNPSQGRGGAGRGNGGGIRGGGEAANNPSNNFITNNQGGINTTHALGVNFIDSWGKKVNFTGSYFLNNGINSTNNTLERINFFSDGKNQFYKQNNIATSNNTNQRINLRLEYNIDSNNSLLITPKLSFQNVFANNTTNANTLLNNSILNNTDNNTFSTNNGISFNNNILYRHKFGKAGRTISLMLGTDVNEKNNQTDLLAKTTFFGSNDSLVENRQKSNTANTNYNLNASINYTENISKTAMLMLNYTPSYISTNNNKLTNQYDSTTKTYSTVNTALSSNFDNIVTTQRGGANIRWRWSEKTNLMIGGNFQYVILEGAQKFPTEYKIAKYFSNVLPNAMLSIKFSKSSNIRLHYRTNTNAPSVAQLQTVIDNSNPLILSTGNANLKQEYTHTFVTRYGFANTDKGKSFYLFVNANLTQDYITNTSLIANNTSTIINGIQLAKGTQISIPENIDGNWSVNSFANYGFPVKKLKSNLNINGGFNYSRTPSKINTTINNADNYTITAGSVLGSNISEKIDFTLSYTANYSIVKNSIQANLNNNYLNQITSFKINWVLLKQWVVRSEINNTNFTGLSSTFNQNFFLWSGGIAYKFLKNNAAEIALNTFDILNENNNINRTVSGNYIEDSRTQVLNRYFMLVFTYNIRAFKARN